MADRNTSGRAAAPAFRRATKRQVRLRAALYGPSGSGKTMSALRIASGLGGTIGVIDTENGSASKYSDRWSFDVLDLNDHSINGYTGAIKTAAAAGYDVLVIDSLTHQWQEALAEVDRIARAKKHGNSFAAWGEVTPKQKNLVKTILSFPGHVVVTMRSKTEWVLDGGEGKGKSAPRKVGLAPEQGKGIEYEFDLLLELSDEHIGHVAKDRTGKFQDRLVTMPDETFGAELAEWLSDGDAPEPAHDPSPVDQSDQGNPPRGGHVPVHAPPSRERAAAHATGVQSQGPIVEAELVEDEAPPPTAPPHDEPPTLSHVLFMFDAARTLAELHGCRLTAARLRPEDKAEALAAYRKREGEIAGWDAVMGAPRQPGQDG